MRWTALALVLVGCGGSEDKAPPLIAAPVHADAGTAAPSMAEPPRAPGPGMAPGAGADPDTRSAAADARPADAVTDVQLASIAPYLETLAEIDFGAVRIGDKPSPMKILPWKSNGAVNLRDVSCDFPSTDCREGGHSRSFSMMGQPCADVGSRPQADYNAGLVECSASITITFSPATAGPRSHYITFRVWGWTQDQATDKPAIERRVLVKGVGTL